MRLTRRGQVVLWLLAAGIIIWLVSLAPSWWAGQP